MTPSVSGTPGGRSPHTAKLIGRGDDGLGRRGVRSAVEATCRQLKGPIHVRGLPRRAAEAAGVKERPGALVTVGEALSRLRSVSGGRVGAVYRRREGSRTPVRELFLQAYAQIPGFGEDPGSPPEGARAGDTRLRLVPRGRNYATAGGRGPSNEVLLALLAVVSPASSCERVRRRGLHP